MVFNMANSRRNKFAKDMRFSPNASPKKKFDAKYNEFLEYLKTVHSSKLLNPEKQHFENNDVPEYFLNIVNYIEELSTPENFKYLLGKKIPSRTSKSDASNMTDEQLKDEEIEIKLMYYIKELVTSYQIYDNHSIRNYFINLCTHILGTYSRQNPDETAELYYRFKSIIGLILKLYKNVVLNSTFEWNPETHEDSLHFKKNSDTFGAKLVVTKGASPIVSGEKDIQQLIKERDAKLRTYKEFALFNENIQMLMHGGNISITYKDYYEKCINLIEELIKVINPKEERVIQYYEEKMASIQGKMDVLSDADTLDDPITDFEIFEDSSFNYARVLQTFHNKIVSPSAMKKIQTNINRLLNHKGATQQAQLEKALLDDFCIRVCNSEEKYTSSGHEAYHIDIITPYGIFELQVELEEAYRLDQIGELSAHTNMPGKAIPTLQVPKCLDALPEGESEENYYIISSDNPCSYLKKSDADLFKSKVECLTAHKGELRFDETLGQVILKKYSSFENYRILALEIPLNNPRRQILELYFSKLGTRKPQIKKRIFKHFDPRIKYISSSDIRAFIAENQRFFPSTYNSIEEDQHSMD